MFCLNENGAVVSVLNRVPVFGAIMVEVIGTCVEEEEAAPAADEG
jgi:hypothetical protein